MSTKEPELTLQAREAVRAYVLRLVIPSGFALTALSATLGYFIRDIGEQKAYAAAFREAYERAAASQGTFLSESIKRTIDAEVQSNSAVARMKEALAIADQIKANVAVSKTTFQVDQIAAELAKNATFTQSVTTRIGQQST